MNIDHYVNRKSQQHEAIHARVMKEGVFSVMAECQRPDGKGTSWYSMWSRNTDVDGALFSSERAETLARTIAEFPEVVRVVIVKVAKHLEIVGRGAPNVL